MQLRFFRIFLFSLFLIFTVVGCSKVQQESKTPNQQNSTQESFYFVANEGGGITKIDATTNKQIETIKSDGSVHNVQVSPDGKILGATLVPEMEEHDMGGMEEMNGFAVFHDTSTNKLLKKVEVGQHPAHIVFTQDGKYALVTNNEDNNVTVIDAKTYKVINTIPTGKGPHGFRISQDSKFAYVANMKEDTVSVLDITNFKELKKIEVGENPVTTAVTKDGKRLLVTVNAENVLAVVDLNEYKVEKIPVGEGPAQVFLHPDNKYAFVANQGTEEKPSDTVSKVDLSSKKAQNIKVGRGPHGLVTSPEGKFVYVTNMFEDTVSVIDNEKNKEITKVNVGKLPNGISYKP